jgi:hypothetical protein
MDASLNLQQAKPSAWAGQRKIWKLFSDGFDWNHRQIFDQSHFLLQKRLSIRDPTGWHNCLGAVDKSPRYTQ